MKRLIAIGLLAVAAPAVADTNVTVDVENVVIGDAQCALPWHLEPLVCLLPLFWPPLSTAAR